MADMSRVEIIVNQIKSSPNTKAAVNGFADLLLNTESRRTEDIEKINAEIKALSVVITGNGDPTHSLLARVNRAENNQKEMEVKHEKLNTLVRGKGDDIEEGSMLWVVRKSAKSISNSSRVSWFSALTILGIVLSWIFNLFGIKGG